MVGNFPPYEAFAIGGTNSVRGYEEGSVGSGRSYVVGSGEISFPVVLKIITLFLAHSCSASLVYLCLSCAYRNFHDFISEICLSCNFWELE